MSASLRALVLLASVIICIYTFIIVEINVVHIIAVYMLSCLLTSACIICIVFGSDDIVLILSIIRKLIEIVFLVLLLLVHHLVVWVSAKLASPRSLLCMNSSLLIHFFLCLFSNLTEI